MWILKWLPDWLFYVILLAGVIGYLATYLLRFIPIPLVYMYKTPIQLGSIVAIVIGTFMAGAIHDNAAWEERVHEMEAKMKVAEQQSIEANDKINSKTQEVKTKIVQKQVVVKQYIDREVTKYDNQCVIPKEFIKAHNDAAEQLK
jgi:DNA-binding protein YbaB